MKRLALGAAALAMLAACNRDSISETPISASAAAARSAPVALTPTSLGVGTNVPGP